MYRIDQQAFINLADLVDEARQEAYNRIYADNVEVHNQRLDRLEQKYQQLNPECGSYEGNFTDDIGDAPKPTEDQISKVTTELVTEAITKVGLGKQNSNVFRAIDEYIHGSMKLRGVAGTSLINGTATVKAFTAEGQFHKGLVYYYTHPTRSVLIRKQTDPAYTEWCTMVPLIMSIFKKRGYGVNISVPYSRWSREHLDGLVAPNLIEVMLNEYDFTKEELLDARSIIFKEVSAETTFRTNKKVNTVLKDLDNFSVHMLMQSWCCHPNIRNEYMILDSSNWDAMPEPIITTEIQQRLSSARIPTPRPKLSDSTDSDIPWGG